MKLKAEIFFVLAVLGSLLLSKGLEAGRGSAFLRKEEDKNLSPEMPEVKLDKIPIGPYLSFWDSPAYDQNSGFSSSLTAFAVLAADLDSSSELFEKNSRKRWPLASLTKLMTAVIALEEIGREKEILVSQQAVDTEGAAGNLQVGGKYKAEDLIKMMMINSSNDAAAAVAEILGEKEFVVRMNRKAEALGMKDTVFFDSSGISPLNQSTAQDVKNLLQYAAAVHPIILNFSRAETFVLKGQRFVNINKFAGEKEFLGGKTGYLEEAGQNLVSLFRLGGERVAFVILGSDDRFGDTEKIKDLIAKKQ